MRLKYEKVIFVKLSLSKDYILCDPHLSKKKKKPWLGPHPYWGGNERSSVRKDEDNGRLKGERGLKMEAPWLIKG